MGENYVVVDFETTILDYGSPYNKDNTIVLAVWKVVKNGVSTLKYLFGNEFEQKELVKDCEEADFIVAHNSKFELGWLKRCGLELHEVLPYCTMIGEYVIAGNRPWRLSLNESLKRYNLGLKDDLVGRMIKMGICPSTIPKSWLLNYCVIDVEQADKLFLLQRENLYDNGLMQVQYTRNILTPVLVDIEERGTHLDKERVYAVYYKYANKFVELEAKLNQITGGINLGSHKQLASFLYDTMKFKIPKDHRGKEILTRSGAPSTSQDTLALLKASNKKQRAFLELYTERNNIDSMLTKYLTKMKLCVDENEGILNFAFNQTRTRTHRLSSTGTKYSIQGQNLARILKPLFNPRYDGWKVGEGDGAQLEFRVAAFLGQDERAMQDIANGFDVHSFTASIINDADLQWILDNKGSDNVAKNMRQDAKADTFKPLMKAA